MKPDISLATSEEADLAKLTDVQLNDKSVLTK